MWTFALLVLIVASGPVVSFCLGRWHGRVRRKQERAYLELAAKDWGVRVEAGTLTNEQLRAKLRQHLSRPRVRATAGAGGAGTGTIASAGGGSGGSGILQ